MFDYRNGFLRMYKFHLLRAPLVDHLLDPVLRLLFYMSLSVIIIGLDEMDRYLFCIRTPSRLRNNGGR